MAGNVYSTYELAKDMAEERMVELEQDIFICHTKYRSGEEFVLKVKDEMMNCGDYLYVQKLPFNHRFKKRDNALRELKRFEVKLNKPVMIEKHTYEENGYIKFSHFSLCST